MIVSAVSCFWPLAIGRVTMVEASLARDALVRASVYSSFKLLLLEESPCHIEVMTFLFESIGAMCT